VLVEREGHTPVAESIRVVLARLRQEIATIAGTPLDEKSLSLALGGLSAAVERQLRQSLSYSLLPVINATGVILHTNLGRAPLAAVRSITSAPRPELIPISNSIETASGESATFMWIACSKSFSWGPNR
jgi:hypothetical protein